MTDPRRAIADRRLRNQRIAGAALAGVADVVRWLGGMQFQEYPVARWSVGQRADGLTAADVDRAVADGSVVRTHVLRDTWHLVAAEDVRWMLDLTAPRVRQRNATMYRKLGLDPALLARTADLLADALAGGRHLTRRAVGAVLSAHGITAEGLRLGYVLMHAELEQVICSGARDGKQHTYALMAERVPPAAPRARDEALGELARRYATSHGPATVADLTWWSSLTVADARRGVEIAGLAPTDVGDRRYWCAPADHAPAPRQDVPRAHLVQGYDEYVVAYRESRDVLDVDGLAAVVPPGATMFVHAILLDGQVVGHWRPAATRAPGVETQLARPLDRAESRAVEDAAERYCAFVSGRG